MSGGGSDGGGGCGNNCRPWAAGIGGGALASILSASSRSLAFRSCSAANSASFFFLISSSFCLCSIIRRWNGFIKFIGFTGIVLGGGAFFGSGFGAGSGTGSVRISRTLR